MTASNFYCTQWSEAVLPLSIVGSDERNIVPTGFADLDCVLGGGLHPGTLTVLSGPASVGTSTLLLDIVRHTVFVRGQGAVLYDLDRSVRDIVNQIAAAETTTSRHDVDAHRDELTDPVGLTSSWIANHSQAPLTVAASPHWNGVGIIEDISARCMSSDPPTLIGIDPLVGLMGGHTITDSNVAALARSLKVAALAQNVPMLVSAGLNIDLTDRATDAFNHVADTIIEIYRPDLYDRDDPRAGEAELRIIKARNAPLARIVVAHALHTGRFVDLAPRQ